MNLFSFLDRGVQLSGGTEAEKAAERARQMWLNKLLVDQTRAWLSLQESDRQVLSGLSVLLTLAGLAHAYDKRSDDTPQIRVIRGAISAAEQCAKAGAVITPDHARAFSAACEHAREILKTCSRAAIQHAAVYLDRVTK